MTYFLDASALVKRYVCEPGSDRVNALTRRRPRLLISRLSAVEVPAGIWKRCRTGDVSTADAMRLVARLVQDLREVDIIEVRGATCELAVGLVERHPLRAYDAVQLASAVRWSRETGMAICFVCADRRLATAARHEKIRSMPLVDPPRKRTP